MLVLLRNGQDLRLRGPVAELLYLPEELLPHSAFALVALFSALSLSSPIVAVPCFLVVSMYIAIRNAEKALVEVGIDFLFTSFIV